MGHTLTKGAERATDGQTDTYTGKQARMYRDTHTYSQSDIHDYIHNYSGIHTGRQATHIEADSLINIHAHIHTYRQTYIIHTATKTAMHTYRETYIHAGRMT